jgi:hypothetical protein
MIPVVRQLREMNHNVFIGSGEVHFSLFQSELPGLTYINFPGFRPGYSRFFPQYLSLLFKTPFLFYHIIQEHFRLKRIIQEYSIDIVISDNRFGLWNRNITTVYVTHMPLIPFPKFFRSLEFIGILMHRAIIKKYSFCFIPDLPGELNLSGRLSHGLKLPGNVRFAGIFSRFSETGIIRNENSSELKHNTVILSGPEPQRTILRQKLISVLKDRIPSTVLLEGRPDKPTEVTRSGNITCYNHLPASEMKSMITGSECVITRSGYTTIMELISLNCSALLIPTPGQTEQEYLAGYLSEKGWFTTTPQSKIKDGLSLPPGKAVWPEEIVKQSKILMNSALEELFEEQHKKDQSRKS